MDINGKYIARVGDLVTCPRKGCRGNFPVVSGAEDMTCLGQPVARHGDKTACGATLLASQQVGMWSAESSGGAGAASGGADLTVEASLLIAAVAPTICLECLAKAAAAGQAMVVRD